MENALIVDKLYKAFGRDILKMDTDADILSVTVAHPVIHEVIRFLKEDGDLEFNMLILPEPKSFFQLLRSHDRSPLL